MSKLCMTNTRLLVTTFLTFKQRAVAIVATPHHIAYLCIEFSLRFHFNKFQLIIIKRICVLIFEYTSKWMLMLCDKVPTVPLTIDRLERVCMYVHLLLINR